jgi:hypothetical protein
MINSAALNSVLIATFADTVILNKSGGNVPVQAIFDRVVENNAIGGHAFSAATYTLTMTQDDIANHWIQQFDSITVRGYQYKVLEIINDPVSDLAVIKVKRF